MIFMRAPRSLSLVIAAAIVTFCACRPESQSSVDDAPADVHAVAIQTTLPPRQEIAVGEIEATTVTPFPPDNALDLSAEPVSGENQSAVEEPVPTDLQQVAQFDAPPKKEAEKKEPLYEGWKKPAFALVLTGNQHGYIEPCGCTGLANQKGGLARRTSFINDLVKTRGWNVVPLDVGNQVRRVGRQAEIKFQKTAAGFKDMNYAGVGFGPDDLRLSVDALANVTLHSEEQPSMFVSANVAIILPELTKSFEVATAGGKRIGVTAVIDPKLIAADGSDEISVSDVETSLTKVWPKLAAARCDLYVLMVNGSFAEAEKLAKKFPQFRVVVTTGGGTEPERLPTNVAGTNSIIIKTGAKGMFAGVLGVFESAQGLQFEYQRVPLDDRFPDSRDVLKMLAAYQKDLELQGFDKLGVRSLPHPTGNDFVGSSACGECHTKAYEIWEKTPHAHATDSIAKPGERSDIARHYDPECLSCHVTGWNPQRYYPYQGGYLSLEKSPLLTGNGCENCHGPGSKHVAAENGDIAATDAQMAKFRDDMKITLAEARKSKCYECHDLDNDPNFHDAGAFDRYWPKIEHKGLD